MLELQFSLQLHIVEMNLALEIGFTLKKLSGFKNNLVVDVRVFSLYKIELSVIAQ